MSNYINRLEISREYKKLKAQKYGDIEKQISDTEILHLTLMAIDSCPTANVTDIKRGNWECYFTDDETPEKIYCCSECGSAFSSTSNFCRNCGAQLERKQNDY